MWKLFCSHILTNSSPNISIGHYSTTIETKLSCNAVCTTPQAQLHMNDIWIGGLHMCYQQIWCQIFNIKMGLKD